MYSQELHPEFYQEFTFTASRSGGAGGQNVNKVSSKVELKFNVQNSIVLSEEEKTLIVEKLRNKINKEGDLIITSQEARSQLLNKQNTVKKFFKLINSSILQPKSRRATKPHKTSIKERLKSKKIIGAKKISRNFIDFDEN